MLEKERAELRRLLGSLPGNWQATEKLRQKYREERLQGLQSELEQYAQLKVKFMKRWERGQNERHLLHPNEKASNRKKVERLKKKMEEINGDIRAVAAHMPSPSSTPRRRQHAAPPVPPELKSAAIDAAEGLTRCAEELSNSPGHFAALTRGCRADAAKMRGAADGLFGRLAPRSDHGRASLLLKLAHRREALAKEAQREARGYGVTQAAEGAVRHFSDVVACGDLSGFELW